MKRLNALIMLLLVCSSSYVLKAQTADSWVSVPIEGDQLTVQMPKNHKSTNIRDFVFDRSKLDGCVYTATEDGVDYSVFSLVDNGTAWNYLPVNVTNLDYCADLVWESLLKPLRDQLSEESKLQSRMSYKTWLPRANLEVNGFWRPTDGREYSIRLDNKTGKTLFYVTGRQIYVLVVLNEDSNPIAAQRFVNSFRIKKEFDPKLIPTGTGGGIAPEEPVVFTGKDVTQKARIISKPEPQYTESARKYSVTGTVVIRAVFSSSGEVSEIQVVKGLPHGLTGQARDAAKKIKFSPAQKDGQDVSMHIQLEYNFNLY